VPNTGGWQNWSTVSVPVTLAAGQQVMKVVFDTGGFNLGSIAVAATPPALPAPPTAPAAPTPTSGITGLSTSATMTWSSSGATSYDVNFGSTNPPAQVATGVPTAAYASAGMANSTTYFWQVVARNAGGATPGPVWSFTTIVAPPTAPNSPTPANGAGNV